VALAHVADPSILTSVPPRDLRGTVRRAVVDDDDLQLVEVLAHERVETLSEVLLDVVDRHDHAQRDRPGTEAAPDTPPHPPGNRWVLGGFESAQLTSQRLQPSSVRRGDTHLESVDRRLGFACMVASGGPASTEEAPAAAAVVFSLATLGWSSRRAAQSMDRGPTYAHRRCDSGWRRRRTARAECPEADGEDRRQDDPRA